MEIPLLWRDALRAGADGGRMPVYKPRVLGTGLCVLEHPGHTGSDVVPEHRIPGAPDGKDDEAARQLCGAVRKIQGHSRQRSLAG